MLVGHADLQYFLFERSCRSDARGAGFYGIYSEFFKCSPIFQHHVQNLAGIEVGG